MSGRRMTGRGQDVLLTGPFLTVRLVGPKSSDVAAVRSRLGIDVAAGRPESLGARVGANEPDLVVRYEDADPAAGGRGAPRPALDVTVTGDEVLLGRPGSGVALPIDGPPTAVRCSRGSGCPEVLVPLAALAALRNGALPVHGTAFGFHGRGMVVTGRSGAGKTGVLLRALARGAGLIAAEHVVLGSDGLITGRREAVRLRPRHRRELRSPAWQQTRRLAVWEPVVSAVGALADRSGPTGRVGRRLRDGVRHRAIVDLPPESFPADDGPTELTSLVLLLPANCRSPEIVAPEPEETAVRLGVLFRDELAGLIELEQTVTHVTGEPDRWRLAEAEQQYRTSAATLLAGRRLLLVRVPPGELSAPHAGEIVEHLVSHSEAVSA
jgi:hypothetical protein